MQTENMGRKALRIELRESEQQELQEGYTQGATPALRQRCH